MGLGRGRPQESSPKRSGREGLFGDASLSLPGLTPGLPPSGGPVRKSPPSAHPPPAPVPVHNCQAPDATVGDTRAAWKELEQWE